MPGAPEVPPPLVGPVPSSVHITRARQGGSLEALPRGTGVIWVTWGAAPQPWRLPAFSPPWGLGHSAWKRAEEMKWKETGVASTPGQPLCEPCLAAPQVTCSQMELLGGRTGHLVRRVSPRYLCHLCSREESSTGPGQRLPTPLTSGESPRCPQEVVMALSELWLALI